MPKIYGVQSLSVEHSWDSATRIRLELIADQGYDANFLYTDKIDWDETFPGDVVVKCQHCGQWAARKTCCKHCGAPID